MADPFVAEIRIFPFNFAPKGWAFCDGQLMPISQNTALFSLLDARSIGMDLTESGAMTPTAAVSGLYFAHPQSRYFAIGKIERDPVADYAHRKGMDIAQGERWLAPILNY